MSVHAAGRRARLRHVPALDGLRGLAVSGVLLFHADHLSGGFLGVDLFFVLSGYLITSLLLAEWRDEGRISLRAFWARRARRLLPALFGVLIGVGLYTLIWAGPAEFGQIRADGLSTLAYVANWHSILDQRNYFDLFVVPSPLEHTWSLAIEEQFYLLWPLVVVAVLHRWRSPGVVLRVAVLASIASVLLSLALYHGGDPSRVYYGTDSRAASILFGCGLAGLHAIWGHTRRRRARALLEVAGVAALLGVIATWVVADGTDEWLYRGGLWACGLGVVVVIAAVTHPSKGPLARTLSVAPLCWLGAISYGLYLWHWPVYVLLTPERTGLGDWPLTVLRIAVSVALAVVSFHLIESPVRRGALTGAASRLLTPAVTVSVAALLLAVTIGGIPASSFADVAAPATPQQAGAPRVLVVGDSVAFSLGARLTELGGRSGINTTNGAISGCTLGDAGTRLRGFQGALAEVLPCSDDWQLAVDSGLPRLVLLETGGIALDEVEVDGVWTHPCMPEFDEWYRGRLRAAQQVLGSRGAITVLATTAHPTLVGVGPDIDAHVDCANDVVRSVASEPGFRLIDLDAFVCPAGECVREIGGAKIREDGLHYSGVGGQAVAAWLALRLLEIARS